MGQKQKVHAEANAENISGPHEVGQPKAASISSIRLRLYFLLWPHVVFSALAPYYIVFLGLLGPTSNGFSASLYMCINIVGGRN